MHYCVNVMLRYAATLRYVTVCVTINYHCLGVKFKLNYLKPFILVHNLLFILSDLIS